MDIDIRTLLSRLNPECKRAMTRAAELCVQHTHYNVELEHLLLALLETPAPDVQQVLRRFGLDATAIAGQLQENVDRFKRGNGRTPALSPHFAPLFQEAWLLSAMLLGQQQVRSGTVILALLEVDSLRGVMLEIAPTLLEIPRETLRQELAGLLSFSSEDAGAAAPGGASGAPAAGGAAGASPAGGATGTPAAGGASGAGLALDLDASGASRGTSPALPAPPASLCSFFLGTEEGDMLSTQSSQGTLLILLSRTLCVYGG